MSPARRAPVMPSRPRCATPSRLTPRAVAAARQAFASYSESSREDRLALLQRIVDLFVARNDELAQAMTAEMGSPITFSKQVQTENALAHFKQMVKVLRTYKFERPRKSAVLTVAPDTHPCL